MYGQETQSWPDYEVPAGVGGGAEAGTPAPQGDEPTGPAPAGQSDALSGTGSPAAGSEPAAPTAHGQQPNAQPGQQPGQPQYVDANGNPIPPYRVAQILEREQRTNQQLAAALAEVNKLKQGLGAALGLVQPGQRRLTDAEQKVVNRIFELIPGLQSVVGLSGKIDQINKLLDLGPTFEATQQATWDRHSQQVLRNVFDTIAPAMLNDPTKKGSDLSAPQQRRLAQAFYAYVSEDRQRVARYEQGDPTLVSDFKADLEAVFFGPARRVQVAGVQQRVQNAARLPQGGNAAPVGTPPPQPNPADEDAVHKAGWQALQQAMRANA